MQRASGQSTEKTFTLGEVFGAREVVQFRLAQPGRILLEASWAEHTQLALILNGPGRNGSYARKDGYSPLTLEYEATAQDLSAGDEWRASIVNFSRTGPAIGSLRVSTPATAPIAQSEGAVVASLQEINTAEAVYASRYGKGFPASLEQLGPPPAGSPPDANHAGLIDATLASAEKNGYLFGYGTGGTPGFLDGYSVQADPRMGEGATGGEHYYTNQSGGIWHSSQFIAGPDLNGQIVTGGLHPVPALPLVLGGQSTGPPANRSENSRFIVHTKQGDVAVLDFFRRHPAFVTPDGSQIFLEQTPDFQFSFDKDDSSFGIALTSKPLRVARLKAESALLRDLGISKGDACKLTMWLGVPVSIDLNAAGRNFGLSFCPSGIPLPGSVGAQSPMTPSGQTVSLRTSQGTIAVKNFYSKATAVTPDTVALRDDFRNLDHYQMGYNRLNSQFYIMLDTYSLEDAVKYRRVAEADFLHLLGVTRSDACKLNVDLRVNPTYVQAVPAGNFPKDLSLRNYGLSFCHGGLPLR